ncbi:MAG: type II toxin-antitoxin system RelE/ParE family toxin [Kofleriaceae bacterium]
MKHRQVHYTTPALEDLSTILEYAFGERGLAAAVAIDDAIDRAIASLEKLSERGRVVPELRDRGVTEYRELIAAPYRVVFRIDDHDVWVVAIVDGRRDLEELLYERARRAALE